jgi:hypothetical protein
MRSKKLADGDGLPLALENPQRLTGRSSPYLSLLWILAIPIVFSPHTHLNRK